MIQLFASDLDGTLLNDKHMVDEKIIHVIEEIRNHNKYFAIATGRCMFEGQRKEFDCIKENGYTICMNGALIYDHKDNVVYKKILDKEIVRDILKTFPTIPFECCLQDKVLLRVSEEKYRATFVNSDLWKMPNGQELYKYFSMYNVYDVRDEEMIQSDVLKINCRIRESELREQLFEYLEKNGNKIINAPFEENFFEITDKEVNKATAIEKLAEILGINEDEIAVYGDGCNDLQMLIHFKHSYAPENAHIRAKECASEVIGHCKDYAVCEHILKTLEEEK